MRPTHALATITLATVTGLAVGVGAVATAPISRPKYPGTPRRSYAHAGVRHIARQRGAGAAGAPRPCAHSAARGPSRPNRRPTVATPRPVRPRGQRPVGALLHPSRPAQRSRRNRSPRPRNLVAAHRRAAHAPSLGRVGAHMGPRGPGAAPVGSSSTSRPAPKRPAGSASAPPPRRRPPGHSPAQQPNRWCASQSSAGRSTPIPSSTRTARPTCSGRPTGTPSGSASVLFAQRLGPAGLTLAGDAIPLLQNDASWETPLIENPTLVRVDRRYILLYSGGWWESDRYATGYATGDTPLGPCTKLTSEQPLHASDPASQDRAEQL